MSIKGNWRRHGSEVVILWYQRFFSRCFANRPRGFAAQFEKKTSGTQGMETVGSCPETLRYNTRAALCPMNISVKFQIGSIRKKNRTGSHRNACEIPRQLTDEQITLLSRGLKFIPLPVTREISSGASYSQILMNLLQECASNISFTGRKKNLTLSTLSQTGIHQFNLL